jgi:hypothetical protein
MLAMGRGSSMAVGGARGMFGWADDVKSRDAVKRRRPQVAMQAISHLQRQARPEFVLSDRD